MIWLRIQCKFTVPLGAKRCQHLNVCYSLIFTHLNYCILAWGSAAKIALLPLHILKKKSSEVDHKPKLHSSHKPIAQETETINNKCIHKLEVAKYMFKMIQLHSGTTPSLFTPLSSLHNYCTRNSTTNFFVKKK